MMTTICSTKTSMVIRVERSMVAAAVGGSSGGRSVGRSDTSDSDYARLLTALDDRFNAFSQNMQNSFGSPLGDVDR